MLASREGNLGRICVACFARPLRIARTALLCLLLPVAPSARINANVAGRVSDASGAWIPGVEVRAHNGNTGIVTTKISNETGSYEFSSLQPGLYEVTASLPGFQKSMYGNVQPIRGQEIRLNFTLEVRGVAQAVDVTVAADTVLATTMAPVGSVLGETQVRIIPPPPRNVVEPASISPGVVGKPD